MSEAPQDFSPQQVGALKLAQEWFAAENGPQIFRLFGYAGTGKTTLALAIARMIRATVREKDGSAKGAVLFAAFTGKAALVLQSKGCRGASTIHSLIYKLDDTAPGDGNPTFLLNPDSDLSDAKLVIIDECSMVGEELARDLLGFGVKVLVLGDPAQLPPVGDGTGFFTNATPDAMLSEVHRQAEGNPIIRLSMDVRNGVALQYGDHGACKVVPWMRDAVTSEDVLAADQLLVGRNVMRTRMNERYRKLKGYKRETPLGGEKLVCLRNDRKLNLFNGGLWRVAKLAKFHPAHVAMVIEPDDAGEAARAVKVKVHPAYFTGADIPPWGERKGTQDMTFGYALTVHKAQGSQWKNVILFNEAAVFGQDATRWLYTGITRAAETLTVVM